MFWFKTIKKLQNEIKQLNNSRIHQMNQIEELRKVVSENTFHFKPPRYFNGAKIHRWLGGTKVEGVVIAFNPLVNPKTQRLDWEYDIRTEVDGYIVVEKLLESEIISIKKD